MGFSRQEDWNGHIPGDLPQPGIEPTSLVSPALTGGVFLPLRHPGSPGYVYFTTIKKKAAAAWVLEWGCSTSLGQITYLLHLFLNLQNERQNSTYFLGVNPPGFKPWEWNLSLGQITYLLHPFLNLQNESRNSTYFLGVKPPGFLPVPESTGSRAGFIGSAQRWVRAWYLHGLESLSCLLLQRSPGDIRRKPGKRIEPKAIVLKIHFFFFLLCIYMRPWLLTNYNHFTMYVIISHSQITMLTLYIQSYMLIISQKNWKKSYLKFFKETTFWR